MENWGLVTYRTTAVLFDEKHSDTKYRVRVAYVVAHGKLSFKSGTTIAEYVQNWHISGSATW